MPTRVEEYRAALRDLVDWAPYLRDHSNLPGPRGNLELAAAVAELGTLDRFRVWAALDADAAPENTPEGFVAFCGVMGLAASLGRGAPRDETLNTLRLLANDPRWRIREAVATGLQAWGDADEAGLLDAMREWSNGSYLERRAATAALCEPRLLRRPEHALAVLNLLDNVTAALADAPPADRRTDPYKTLRQALGYCWSVAVVALPDAGKPRFERWLASDDADVRWITRENLRKNRLVKLDAAWTARCAARAAS